MEKPPELMRNGHSPFLVFARVNLQRLNQQERRNHEPRRDRAGAAEPNCSDPREITTLPHTFEPESEF